jgi:hypothetical protein
VAQGAPTNAFDVGSIGGKHGEAEAVSEASVELLAYEIKGSGEWESIQPGRDGVAGAAEEPGRARLPSSVPREMRHAGRLHGPGQSAGRQRAAPS